MSFFIIVISLFAFVKFGLTNVDSKSFDVFPSSRISKVTKSFLPLKYTELPINPCFIFSESVNVILLIKLL